MKRTIPARTRIVQRTPDLGLTLRLQRAGQTSDCPAPTPILGWWDEEAGSFTRQVETMSAGYDEPSVPRAVIACLDGAGPDVVWTATWQGEALIVPGYVTKAGYYGTEISPEVLVSGQVATAIEGAYGHYRRDGVLMLWADWAGTRYGPITLVVANAYYGAW